MRLVGEDAAFRLINANRDASESDLGDCFTTCLQLMFNYFLLKEPKLVQFVIATEQHAT